VSQSFATSLLSWLKRFAAGLGALVAGVLVLLVIVLAGFRVVFLMSEHEVARVESPDHTLDAVVFETDSGAAKSFGYEVQVMPHRYTLRGHQEAAYVYRAMRSDSAYGVNVRWTGPRALAIEYLHAGVTVVHPRISPLWSSPIDVVLDSEVVDPRAPAGGMAYNLHRAR
jgi:hypothetical protein